MNFDLGPYGSVSSGDIAGGLGVAGALAGGILGAMGAHEAARGQQAAYLANAGAAATTAVNTRVSLGRSQQEADYLANRLIGRQRAAYAAGGVDPGSGSPLDVMGDTENQIKFEAMNRFYTGEMAAKTASDQVTFDTEAGRRAARAGSAGATASILSGIGSAFNIAKNFI